MLTIVSYNIRRQSSLYKKMVELVKNNSNVIVAIQERPSIQEMKKISQRMPKCVKHQYFTNRNELAVIHSSSLSVLLRNIERGSFDKRLFDERALVVSIPLKNGNFDIVNVHGYSKIHKDSVTLNNKLFEMIKDLQKSSKHIIIGDFNINPYEEHWMHNQGIFLSYRNISSVKNLNHNDVIYYNPCWKYMCERSFPEGTIFYDKCMLQWAMFDQVLIAKSLVDENSFRNFEIPQKLGTFLILEKNCSKKKYCSDHLPIKLTLEV